MANAGVWPSEDVPVAELPLERWRDTIDGNLGVTFLTARGFARGLARRGGRSSSIGSTAGRFGEAGHADYAAAKAAIGHGLLLSLKNELAPARVNVVAPGWTVSPMTEASLTDERRAGRRATMPLRKVARTEDIARAVVFLLLDRAGGACHRRGGHGRRRHGGPLLHDRYEGDPALALPARELEQVVGAGRRAGSRRARRCGPRAPR